MKVFIGCDIEGVTGVTYWHETENTKEDYDRSCIQMTREVNACCLGVLEEYPHAEILVKDSHGRANNLIMEDLPRQVKIMRGWGQHEDLMVEAMDESYDAVMFVGYHSASGKNTNPLSHTYRGSFNFVKLNGLISSEFYLMSIIADQYKVKPIFISGDKGVCLDAQTLVTNIETVEVKECIGSATINIHPHLAVDLIKEGAKKAIKNMESITFEAPKTYHLEVSFKKHTDALRCSRFDKATLTDDITIEYKTDDYNEFSKFLAFGIFAI